MTRAAGGGKATSRRGSRRNRSLIRCRKEAEIIASPGVPFAAPSPPQHPPENGLGGRFARNRPAAVEIRILLLRRTQDRKPHTRRAAHLARAVLDEPKRSAQ